MSQRQNKLQSRSIAHFSRLSEYFPHAFTCNPSCVEVPWLWEAWSWEKKIWIFFEKILSHLSFTREVLQRWNCGKRAKWFFWEVNRPGEAFRRMSRKKSGQKTAEIYWDFKKFRQKSSNLQLLLNQFSSDFDQNLCTYSLDTAGQYWCPRANRSGHLETRYGLSNLKKVKIDHFCVGFLRISRLTMEFGKNGPLHFFIARQLRATCKVSGKSYEPVWRSISEFPY